MNTFIDPFNCLELMLSKVVLIDEELINFSESLGRVLSKDLFSKLDLPPYDNASMDGYAIRYSDILNNKYLKVIGTIKCGDKPIKTMLQQGECYKIMTGGFIPFGADSVVEFEKTNAIDSNLIEIIGDVKKGTNIREKGEDIRRYEELPFKGNVITPAILARLISTGNFTFKVYRRPTVALISTGNELVAPCDTFNEYSIIESNSVYVKNSLKGIGVKVINKGISKDEFKMVKSILSECSSYNAIITIGGISKGDFDIIKLYGDQLSIDWLFNGVNQKPGKPFSFGFYKDIPIFSLPGNPVSSAFCCFFYLIPFFKKMIGYKNFHHRKTLAILKDSIVKKTDRVGFFSTDLNIENGRIVAYPYKRHSSHLISSLVNAKGYVIIDKNVEGEIAVGSEVDVFFNDIPYL